MKKPRVSIGMPVYNGERYLREALDSICKQTFESFELIISDNGSTDATEIICREYASQDRRITYLKNKINAGGAWNFKRVFDLATGEYFKWAAHDDVCAPEFIERCVEVLDADKSYVLAYSSSLRINQYGLIFGDIPVCKQLESNKPQKRLYASIFIMPPHIQLFALIRRDMLKKIPSLGSYTSSDRVLVGEIALWGRFYGVEEYLFSYREHSEQSIYVYPTLHQRQVWFDPERGNKLTFPYWRLLYEHLASIGRVPLTSAERVRCCVCMIKWVMNKRGALACNLFLMDRKVSIRRQSLSPDFQMERK